MSDSRYQGKPLLRLLECYVLKAIDSLSEEQDRTLASTQPKLAELYKLGGTWDEIIAGTMELPENMPELIRQTWARNQEIAKANDVELSPQQFAEMFVDANLI